MFKIWTLVIAGICLNVVSANQFCEMDCKGKKHTMCLYETDALNSRCPDVKTNVLTAEEKEEILKVHNELRFKHAKVGELGGLVGPVRAEHMRQLNWNDELAQIAQRWANQCINGHDECRKTWGVDGVGQNIASGIGDVKELVNLWYGDLQTFNTSNYDKITDKKESENIRNQAWRYTSFIWGGVNELGCGIFKSKTGINTLVCNYGPTKQFINFP